MLEFCPVALEPPSPTEARNWGRIKGGGDCVFDKQYIEKHQFFLPQYFIKNNKINQYIAGKNNTCHSLYKPGIF